MLDFDIVSLYSHLNFHIQLVLRYITELLGTSARLFYALRRKELEVSIIGEIGRTSQGDIAIDNISFKPGRCTYTQDTIADNVQSIHATPTIAFDVKWWELAVN
ncbi:hypothetical protein AC249_AIPGENE27485 [Exaiptasia diaphana]|nr:hypothetical protein AC249_AIPGENE27485 [Exaiptasia diaphana]